MSTNDSLAARARAGDAEAFAELYRQVYQDLYRFALYTLKNPQDAEDAVGDAVADAFASIKTAGRRGFPALDLSDPIQ